MIVVRIELWPFGNEATAREIGRTYIWNKGDSSDPKRGNYGIAVRRKSKLIAGKGEHPAAEAARTGEVKDYPRLSYNVWRLIIRALKSAFPEEA